MISAQESRRGFLRYLAASPLLGAAPRSGFSSIRRRSGKSPSCWSAENSGRGTIESLPEVVDAVGGRIPVFVDGGFRRGVDIFKALAIGADAVCIGRPYLWGLSAFGQEGVETVLDLLRRELVVMMQQAGTTSLDAINRNYLVA